MSTAAAHPAPEHEDIVRGLSRTLFSGDITEHELSVYAVLDGASVPDLIDHLYADDGPEFVCLYRGEIAPDMAEVAPYLVELKPGSDFAGWLLSECSGNHWGIFVVSGSDLDQVRRHFRRMLIVKGPKGEQLYFRFYDPRVFRTFLPSCASSELVEVFGDLMDKPVLRYFCEAQQAGIFLRYSMTDKLVAEEINLAAVESSPA